MKFNCDIPFQNKLEINPNN